LSMLTLQSTILTVESTLKASQIMQRRLNQVDMLTGEILEDGFVAYVVPKRKNGFSIDGWWAMSKNAATILKQVTNLEDFRVLMALLEKLDFENLILANQAEIAKELNMDRAQVNRAIKRLVKMEAIFEGPKIGISRSYQLSPSFGWRGSSKNHVRALDEIMNERMKVAGINEIIKGGKF
jgi:hypothetical protein